jgi:hypothetical protein
MSDWKKALALEFERAETARERGNEGRARVCARRAAGIAAREYLTRRNHPVPSASAYEILKLLTTLPDLPPDLRPVIVHLTMRVTEEFQLPIEADLIEEARHLCVSLLPDWES